MALAVPSVPPMEDGDARRAKKVLGPLGHHLALLGQAVESLRNRLAKGRIEPGLADFLGRWLPERLRVEAADGDALWVLVSEKEGKFRLESAVGVELPLPVWALLRLPSLRGLWEKDLRRNHVRDLGAISPDVWVMDPTPIPPGAVVAGLDLPSWDHWRKLRGTGRVFEIVGGTGRERLDDEATESKWQGAISAALTELNRCLVEHALPDYWWWARFSRTEGQIEMSGARRAAPAGEGWAVTQVLG